MRTRTRSAEFKLERVILFFIILSSRIIAGSFSHEKHQQIENIPASFSSVLQDIVCCQLWPFILSFPEIIIVFDQQYAYSLEEARLARRKSTLCN